jgi:hypothetical protein
MLYICWINKTTKMTSAAIKEQLDSYLPLLSNKQQALLLEMAKSLLNVEGDSKRITRKQYNKEITEAVDRIEKGNFVSDESARKELSR